MLFQVESLQKLIKEQVYLMMILQKKRLEDMASIHALGRIGTPMEIAEAIEYLICAEWTTGAVLEVDGGLGLGLTNA